MTENQDLVERLIKYDIPRIAQVEELYYLMENHPPQEYTLSALQERFRGFPVKDRELVLFLDLHARCNGNSGLVFEEAIRQKMETFVEEEQRYEEIFGKPYRN